MTDIDRTAGGAEAPDPAATVEEARARGVFLVPRCEDCGRTFWHPRRHCPHCLSTRVGCIEPEGDARVATWTRNHRAQGSEDVPATLGYVELGDGLLVLARLELPDAGDPVGMAVTPQPRRTADGGLTVVFAATATGDDGGR